MNPIGHNGDFPEYYPPGQHILHQRGGMDMGLEEQLPHKLTLDRREKLTVSGVTEVVSFDENCVVVGTGLGRLVIQGEGLRLKQLTPEGGNVTVEGKVGSLAYEELRTGGWLRRLLG